MRRSLRIPAIAFQNLASFGVVLAAVGCGGSATSGETGTHDSGVLQTALDSGVTPATSDDAGSEDAGSDDASDAADTSFSDDGGVGVIAVPLEECEGLQYVAPMTIGTQNFEMIIDTGSTTLGVAASTPDAGTCTGCGVTPLYTPGPGATDEGVADDSPYETGSWSGVVYKDSVGFATDPTIPLNFVAITAQSGFFSPTSCGASGGIYQGIVGFAHPAAELTDTAPFFDQYYAAKGIANVFSVEFCDNGGTLWLGGFDPTYTTAAPKFVPFTSDFYSQVYYAVGLTSIKVAGTTVPVASKTYADSLVDTGTNIFVLGTDAFNGISAAISGSAGFKQVFGASSQVFAAGSVGSQASCGGQLKTKAEIDAALPALTLNFGSTQVQALPSESYLAQNGSFWCSELDPSPQDPNNFPFAAILGAPVLRSNVVIFDRAKNRLGFAPHKPCAGE